MLNDVKKRREVIDMIKELAGYFNNVRDALCAPYGLSSIQAVIVLDVYHHPNATKVTDICKRLHKSTNTISPLINRLVAKGFLEKKQGESDARITYISLTEKTKAITKNINIDIYDFTWPMFESITEEEFVKIYEALKILCKVTSQ